MARSTGSIKAAIKEQLTNYLSATTAHGVPHLVSERKPVRILWAFILVCAVSTFVMHLSTLIRLYLEYPLRTSVMYKATPFEFPDVTICNLLPTSLRKLELKDPEFARLSQMSDESHDEDVVASLFADTDHDLHSVIISCAYNQQECGLDNFTVMHDPVFRNCFTFSATREVITNSPSFGLNLVVYAENRHVHSLPDFKNSFAEDWEASGVRLVIHERGTHPHPQLKGVNLQTGVDARFALNIERFDLYDIYRDGQLRCDDDHSLVGFCNEENQNSEGSMRVYKESTEDCYIRIIQTLSMNNCNCLSPTHEVPGTFCRGNSTMDYCDEHLDCYKHLKDKISSDFQGMVIKQCQPTCDQVSYLQALSVSDWPSHVTEKRVLKDIRERYRTLQQKGWDATFDEFATVNESVILDQALIKDNFLRITIYPEALMGDLFVEELAYPFPNFISEVGGIVGLWLGCSVLTFLETFGLLANIILVLRSIGRVNNRQPPTATASAEQADADTKVPLQANLDTKVEMI